VIKRLLIANRGEIAVRIIRACRDLGVETVAVHSTADREAMHVDMADHAICIGPASPVKSYLDIPSILAAAKGAGADAVHPGYGFLAENAAFAEACAREQLIFVGPGPDALRGVGDKVQARQTVGSNGVPVVPGSDDIVSDLVDAHRIVERIGLPILLKAKGGGGGRGMRILRSMADFDAAWMEVSAEAGTAFGDMGIYIERYLERVRHVEIQVLADASGSVISLGERDCSVQRRHQKLIEEAPCGLLSGDVKAAMGEAAVKAARSVGYLSAGTVEFLYDLARGRFYFIEMNARIQVEHPVTEALIGVDLVAEQIRIAAGDPISFHASEVQPIGHAIECRINAEDPDDNFLPCPGKLTICRVPGGPGVRVDSHCYEGYLFPPNYDSLMAKLIVHGRDRNEAIRRMRRALQEFKIEGVKTTIPFHLQVLQHPDFVSGNHTTQLVEQLSSSRAVK
jgi:acetyl-CoA carboxylase biotin carboxylase subunit